MEGTAQMREKIERCSICKKQDCDGKEYIVPYRDFQLNRNSHCIVCSSQTEMHGETRTYKVVFGHGNIIRFVAFPIPEPIEIK